MLEKWTSLVIQNRFKVLSLWLILTSLGTFAAIDLDQHLTTSLTVPGSESAKAEEMLATGFNENTEGTFTVLLNFKNASPEEISAFESQIADASRVIPKSRVSLQRAIGGVLITNISTPNNLNEAAKYTRDLRQELRKLGLANAQVTGPPAIKSDVSPVMSDDLKRGQLFAIVVAFIVLILLLGISFQILIPFAFALATISTTLGLVYLIAQKYLMVLYIPNIVELIGFGLALDYSLLIAHRYRGSIRTLKNVDLAISKTMNTAGRTVVISGLIVATGMTSLLLVPIPFVRSLGIAGALIPLVSIFAALTLQPALLSYLGSHGNRFWKFGGMWDRGRKSTSIVARITALVIRRPKAVFVLSISTLTILILPIFALSLTPSSMSALPSNLESSAALNWASDRAGAGATTPIAIIMDLGSPRAATSAENISARKDLVESLASNKEVFTVAGGENQPYVDETGRYLRILIISRSEFGSAKSQSLVNEIRDKYLPESNFDKSIPIYVGGAGAQGVDLVSKLKSALPAIVLLTLIFAYLLLVRAFRSVILPLKAIVLDLLTTAVSYAAIVAVVQYGFASSILHTYKLPQIEAWVLVFVFAVLFGLTMDYEVFIVSRIREAKERGLNNSDAVAEGITETVGVITAAALIMFAALIGLVGGHFAGLQELGLGLAVGVIIDATVVRMFLLPSAMILLGRWNWWAPKFLTSQR